MMKIESCQPAEANGRPMIEPADEHNRRLIANVHPPHWENPRPDGRYNLVVVGAGTAGLVTAAGAAGLGAKVALVERHLMGGDCLNVGCVPSKALVRAARAAADAGSSSRFGVQAGGPIAVDFAAVMERMRRLRAELSPHDSAARFRELGVDVYLGPGAFVGEDALEVAGQTLRFKKAVIATGARAAAPPIPGLAEVGYLTNETVFSLTELPRRIAVIGAGPIGCELAQAFARFGADVTLLEAMRQILGREDRDAAAIVERAILEDGVRINCCVQVERVRREGAEVVLSLRGKGRPRRSFASTPSSWAWAGRRTRSDWGSTRPACGSTRAACGSMTTYAPRTPGSSRRVTSAAGSSSPTRPMLWHGSPSRTPCSWAARRPAR